VSPAPVSTPAPNARQPSRKVAIKGLPISLDTHEEVLAEMGRAIEQHETGRYISITNTESMYHGLRDTRHGDYIRQADFSLCDGVGVIVAGWSWGLNIKRFNGPVLQLEASEHGLAKGWRHYFYGGKEGVAEEMAKRLKEEFPGLIVCGCYTPPFRPLSAEEEQEVTDRINAAKPDIVWVGLGLLKQERWVADHLHSIKAPWMVGVGAAFDYHAGAIPWAPPLVRALGMEWLFRLIIQPKLRAKRYWWSAVYVIQSFFSGLLTAQFLRNPKTSRA
jgi:N-acetylglucosaminyldiphosphoundecaprenol N-acetyl-beta-D-mannosaminyltransferase